MSDRTFDFANLATPQQTTWTPPPMASDDEWNLPSLAEANRVVWDDSFDGVDGYFELINVGPAQVSPFKKRDKQGNPVYEKDASGEIVYGEDGNPVEKDQIQSTWTWMILELEHPRSGEFVGQTINGWYTFSMNTESNMYEAIKALMGGQVDPTWKPKPSALVGKVIKGTIKLGEPKGEKKQRWPKLKNHRVARGFTPPVRSAEPTEDDVPF